MNGKPSTIQAAGHTWVHVNRGGLNCWHQGSVGGRCLSLQGVIDEHSAWVWIQAREELTPSEEQQATGAAIAKYSAAKEHAEQAEAERDTARNRVTALEKNGAELLARAENAEEVIEKVRELLFAFADWPDRDATDFLFRLGRHEMVYRIVAYAFPDELDKVELKPAPSVTETPGGKS